MQTTPLKTENQKLDNVISTEAHFDFVILGSGSAAFAAALRAQELGETSVMSEERTTGRICVNRGCLPSKNLIEAAKLLHDARNPRYSGLTAAEPRLDFRFVDQFQHRVGIHE